MFWTLVAKAAPTSSQRGTFLGHWLSWKCHGFSVVNMGERESRVGKKKHLKMDDSENRGRFVIDKPAAKFKKLTCQLCKPCQTGQTHCRSQIRNKRLPYLDKLKFGVRTVLSSFFFWVGGFWARGGGGHRVGQAKDRVGRVRNLSGRGTQVVAWRAQS